MEPSIELDLEIAEVYLANNYITAANSWARKTLLVDYPRDVRVYEFAVALYVAQDNLRYAFATYDTYQLYGLYSEVVETSIDQIRYLYRIDGEYTDVAAYSNASYLVAVQLGEYWGYMNQDSNLVVSAKYQTTDLFVSGLAAVVDSEGVASCIDESGNIKIVSSYFKNADGSDYGVTELKTPQSGMILAYNGSTWQYFEETTYRPMFEAYEQATSFVYNVAAVQKSGEKWKLIDSSGNDLTSAMFEEILINEKGIAYVSGAIIAKQSETSGYQLYNTSGEAVSSAVYQDAKAFIDNTYAAVQKADGSWIFVNAQGEEQSFGSFEDANSFSNGFAAVKQDGLWGFINTSGEMVIENVFYDATFFSNRSTCFVKTSDAEDANWEELELYSAIY